MITLDGLTIALDSIDSIKEENGAVYVYTKDCIKIGLTLEEYELLKQLNKQMIFLMSA